jgi:TonB family protein
VDQQTRSLNITRQENQSAPNQQNTGEVEKKSKYKLDLTDKKLRTLTEKGGPNPMFQSMTSNYLPEITIGSETLLNTKEFAFHTFYIRMKREIETFWHPDRSLPAHMAMQGTYITSITVILDDQGELIDTHIYKSSGIQALDVEAVRSIEQASPYPNPPKELLMEDKRIRVNWNFIFDRTSLM